MSKRDERVSGRRGERRNGEHRRGLRRMVRGWGLYAGLGVLLARGGAIVVTGAVTAKLYPPSGMQDHVESYPPCRICSEPITEAIQRHIMEHRAPGKPEDRPGILVQYNCASCPELVAKLTRIVERHPRAVYLAPYPKMSPRIALTTLGRLEAMDDVDEARVTAFIEKYL